MCVFLCVFCVFRFFLEGRGRRGEGGEGGSVKGGREGWGAKGGGAKGGGAKGGGPNGEGGAHRVEARTPNDLGPEGWGGEGAPCVALCPLFRCKFRSFISLSLGVSSLNGDSQCHADDTSRSERKAEG